MKKVNKPKRQLKCSLLIPDFVTKRICENDTAIVTVKKFILKHNWQLSDLVEDTVIMAVNPMTMC